MSCFPLPPAAAAAPAKPTTELAKLKAERDCYKLALEQIASGGLIAPARVSTAQKALEAGKAFK